MFRPLGIVAAGGLAWLIGLHALAALLLGIVALIGIAAFGGNAVTGCRDRTGRELYRRNMRTIDD